MTRAGRARRPPLGPAALVVLATGSVTTLSAVPLFFGEHDESLVVVHVVAAGVFFGAVIVKLALLGRRARPGRARRLWRLLVAQMASVLALYTLLTGVVVALDPTWSDQHLAASFWLGALVVAHTRQYAARLRALVRGSRGADRQLQTALGRLDATTLALLDLSLRKRLSDSRLALVLDTGVSEVRHRREQALSRIGDGSPRIEQRLLQLPAEAWRPPARPRPCKRLVVVGGGMAGHAVVEKMVARTGWRVTLLAEEDLEPYNRIGLSDVLRDQRSGGRLALSPSGWYADAHVDLRVGAAATAVDVDGRRVVDRRGAEHRYDALVLATGSRAFRPLIPGVQLDHVVLYRTFADANRISAAARSAPTAVVIGGGLLALEAAAALAKRGVAVTVVEAADRLMPQQLDAAAASMVRRALGRLGVEAVVGTTVTEITRAKVRLADDSTCPAELVVVAAGTRAETSLARTAGIRVEHGIVVDDHMRTSAAAVWALGECAEHRGVVHGLWAPVVQQVRAAAASLDGDSIPFRPAPPQTTLKVAGLELFAAGHATAEDGEVEIVRSDGRRGTYAKFVLDDDRLVGAIVIGDMAAAARARELIAAGDPVPPDVLDPPDAKPPRRPLLSQRRKGEVVCNCLFVSRERIERAIDEEGLTSVSDIAAATGAGTGCGSCAGSVARLIEERRQPARAPA